MWVGHDYTTHEFQKKNHWDDLGLTMVEVHNIIYLHIKELHKSVTNRWC